VYHFYYGDEFGAPGSVITFFPYTGLVNGRHGKGMLNTTGFSVSASSMDYWMQRFKKFRINHKPPVERFEKEFAMYFEDTDGLGLELVFNDIDKRAGYPQGNIPIQHSIKGFYHVEIWEEGYERTAGLLTGQMDHHLIIEKGNRFRFAATNSPGNFIDVVCMPDSMKALAGSGTVHHIAFSTPDENSQAEVRLRIQSSSLNPTPVVDRNYFSSIYFREPGGVLFEVATAGPGFLTDEDPDHLGESLQLPKWFEQERKRLESVLAPVKIDFSQYK
jgi:glyoxalase family protein